MHDEAVDQILGTLSCPFCGGAYNLVHLMAKPKRPLRAIVRCQRCGKVGIGTIGPRSERQPVTNIDVEKVQEILRDFDGDFKALFERRR